MSLAHPSKNGAPTARVATLAPGVRVEQVDGACVVHLPSAGEVRLPAFASGVLEACVDGASVEALVVQVHAASGVGRQDVALLLESLESQGVIAWSEVPKPAHARSGLEHTCAGCGASCIAQLVGPLDDARIEQVRRDHATLAETYPRVAAHPPFMKGRTRSSEVLTFLHFPGKRCVFLHDDQACLLHRHFGAERKPDACRRFPLMAVEAEDAVRLGVRAMCYRAHRHAEAPAQDASSVDVLRQGASVRPALHGVDIPEAQDEARGQEAQILAWIDADDMQVEALLALLCGVPRARADAALTPAFYSRAAGLMAGMVTALEPSVAELDGTSHGAFVATLVEGLRWLGVLLGEACALPPPVQLSPATQRYVLRSLGEMVFLRETSRYPSVAVGTLALALGALAAGWVVGLNPAAVPATHAEGDETVPDAFAEPFVAWMRLMVQGPAFAALFPTPESLEGLVGTLLDGES